MAWALSSWLAFTRTWQLLAALAAAGMNGFITGSVYADQRGLTQTVVILQLLVCMLLVYTTVALWVLHTGGRSKRKGWLIGFIIFDIMFCAADLAILALLSRAGLPNHCRGLTLSPDSNGRGFNKRQRPDFIPGFSDESEGQVGGMDRYCGFERSFFTIAVVLVFTYIATIVLESLGCYETNHTRNTKVDELLDSLERAKDDPIDLKLLDSNGSVPSQSTRFSVVSPPSEGIITRTASLRSTLTSFTSSTTGQRPHAIPRRPIPQQDAPPLPVRRLSLPKVGPPGAPGAATGFVPIPLDEDSAEAALVADGMQHSQVSQQRSPAPMQHRRTGSSAQAMPMLLEEEQTAESALVSDGMRPEPMLPPYEPPQGRHMAGHGGESNDMRLSEYVKGGTRAQDMKDDGGY